MSKAQKYEKNETISELLAWQIDRYTDNPANHDDFLTLVVDEVEFQVTVADEDNLADPDVIVDVDSEDGVLELEMPGRFTLAEAEIFIEGYMRGVEAGTEKGKVLGDKALRAKIQDVTSLFFSREYYT